jgi:hypothetical protein
MSAHQLWRQLGFGSYPTAWFMAHRIGEGMREAHLPEPMGGEGKTVEIDETLAAWSRTSTAASASMPGLAALARRPCSRWSSAAAGFGRTTSRA